MSNQIHDGLLGHHLNLRHHMNMQANRCTIYNKQEKECEYMSNLNDPSDDGSVAGERLVVKKSSPTLRNKNPNKQEALIRTGKSEQFGKSNRNIKQLLLCVFVCQK